MGGLKLLIKKALRLKKQYFMVVLLMALFLMFDRPIFAINREITYQGKLISSLGVAVDEGSYNMRFRLYDSLSGGSLIWTEIWDGSNGSSKVSVSNSGLFSIALGRTNSLNSSIFNQDSLYLEVAFDPNNDGVYEEVFTPRKKLTASPYSFNSERLSGYSITTTSSPDSIPVLDNIGGLSIVSVTTTADIFTQGTLTVTGNATFNGPAVFNGTLTGSGFDNAWSAAFNATTTWAAFDTNFNSRFAAKSTTNLAEGTNLYYTDVRATANFATNWNSKTTANLPESGNLYFTTERANAAADTRFAANWLLKSTSDLTEGSNLYYTEARATSNFASNWAGKNSDNLSEGSTNLYYTSARANSSFNSNFSAKTSDNLAEGVTNLYYSDGRVDTRINGQKGIANGIASLNSSGKVPITQLSSIVIGNTYVVTSTADMLDLPNHESLVVGDVAILSGSTTTYILQKLTGDTIDDWQELLAPAASIRQVNGLYPVNGSLVINTDNIAEGNTNLYYTDTRADARINLQKGVANGIVPLNISGKINPVYFDAITLSNTHVVDSTSSMVALDVATGTIAIVTNINKTYVLRQRPSSQLSNWVELVSANTSIISVNGNLGPHVVLSSDDILEGSTNKYFSDALARNAISASNTPIIYSTTTGKIGLSYAANLKLTGDSLDTVQDISAASTPTFGGLIISGATSLSTLNTSGLASLNSLRVNSETFTDLTGSNLLLSSGSLSVTNNPSFSGTLTVAGTSTLATTTITSLSVSATSSLASLGVSGNLTFTTAGNNYLYFANSTDKYLLWNNTGNKFTFSTSTDIVGVASSTQLIVNGRFTSPSNYTSAVINTSINNASYSAATYTGLYNYMSMTGSNKNVIANDASVILEASANSSSTYAFNGLITTQTGATILNSYGLRYSLSNNGTITNNYGLYLTAPNPRGTITNNYGLYIGDQTGTGITNSYNIYSLGATSKNYFEGSVGVGTTTPAGKLQVGTVSAAVNSVVSDTGMLFGDNSSSAVFGIENSYTSGSTGGGGFVVYSNDGQPMAANDRLGYMVFGGAKSTSAVDHGASISAYAGSLWTAASTETYLAFETTPAGAISNLGANRYERMRLTGSGQLAIGTTSPSAKLTVWGTGTGTASLVNFINSASTTVFNLLENGNLNISGTVSSTWGGAKIGLAYGGTNANLTASNGGIVYSTASELALLAATSTAGRLMVSGASAAPSWSSAIIISSNNVGIGDTSPSGLLTVGNGDKFTVDASGNVSTAGNVAITGTSTVSGNSTVAGFVGVGTTTNFTLDNKTAKMTIFRQSGYGLVFTGTSTDPMIYDSVTGAALTASGVFQGASSKELKENFIQLNGEDVLAKINNLSLVQYNYLIDGPSVKHFGAMSEDWYQAFSFGNDNRTISPSDVGFIALQGVQEISRQAKEIFDKIKITAASNLISEPEAMAKTLVVTDAANFRGTITVVGEASFVSQTYFHDHVYFDKDTAGKAKIPVGTDFVKITYSKPYLTSPIVTVTPINNINGFSYWIEQESINSFVIRLSSSAVEDINFNWHALALVPEDLSLIASQQKSNTVIDEPILQQPVTESSATSTTSINETENTSEIISEATTSTIEILTNQEVVNPSSTEEVSGSDQLQPAANPTAI